jgi:hypothetical protein
MAGARRVGTWRLARASIAVMGALGMLLFLVAPAQASWTAVRTITLPGWQGVQGPVVAADHHGDTVLAWTACKDPTCDYRIQARIRFRGGRLGRVKTLSPSGLPPAFPQVAADDAGDSAVVWEYTAGDSMVVWSQGNSTPAVFGRGVSRTGSLGPLTRLGLGDQPAVTIDDVGHGLVVWQSLPDSNQVTKVYARPFSRTGRFGLRTRLSSDGDSADAASSPSGHFSVIWDQSSIPWPIRARFGP